MKNLIRVIDYLIFSLLFYIIFVLVKDLFSSAINMTSSQKFGAIIVIIVCIYVILRISSLLKYQRKVGVLYKNVKH